MNILITGAAGFIGSHVADIVADNNRNESMTEGHLNIFATFWDGDQENLAKHLEDKIKFINCDLRNQEAVEILVREANPDIIYHLGAQSFVTVSWKEPKRTLETNIMGTFNILEAVRKLNLDPKILIACSSAEYGAIHPEELPVAEGNPLRPTNPYATSKVGQDMLGYQYNKNYGMKTVRVRFFNISGPRKIGDACSDFAKRIAEIQLNRRSDLIVGNTNVVRDITDVRDAVKALQILTEKAIYGDVYNVCSGKQYKIADIVDKLIQISGIEIQPQVDQQLLRKVDDPIFVGDNSKITGLGWQPIIPIETTLKDMYDWWLNRLKNVS
jgi:GDP-4-dehydro-6-deoxy-D-mannose reductase